MSDQPEQPAEQADVTPRENAIVGQPTTHEQCAEDYRVAAEGRAALARADAARRARQGL
ncbi:hypothetical protein G3I34_21720 [Streptomyces sp. SID8014]|uniref:hypothetical protein n=1 Tax=Streptomyces sp. SID8014 TaxID=2706097 RepID=UPI0013BA56CA|nr:hypothetical protein [Streptomyces sp. SID8014]NEC14836.1 hypothetical protein [Streptomyces sp. SID8014]